MSSAGWAVERLALLRQGFLRFAILFLLTGLALAAPAVAEASCTAAISTPANTPITRDIYDDFPQCQADLASFTPGPMVTPPSHGAVVWGVAPTFFSTAFRYTPTADYAGSDTFVFQGDTPTAFITVNITVTPTAPVAAASSTTVGYGSTNTNIPLSLTGVAATSVAIVSNVTHGSTTVSGSSISYTPTAGYAGPDSFTYNASNAGGTSSTVTVSLTVSAPTITLAPTTLPDGAIGTAYSQSVTASGGASPYTYSVSAGTLPTGLTLSAAGLLSGTPTTANTFNFTVRATDATTGPAQPYSGTRSYTVAIIAPPAPIAGAASATVAYNSSGNPITLNLSGGTATSVAVATPATNGTATASGTSITYTPTAGYAGPDSFTYTATNIGGTSAPATVTITVSPPTILVAPASLPNGISGIAYSEQLTASGGTGPYSFATTAGALPGGLTLSTGGLLSGTPNATGPFNFTVTASDSSTGPAAPFTDSQAYSVTIAAPNPPVANAASATVAYNSTNNPVTLNITGGTPTSVAVATPATNGTATASGTSITYTPTAGYFGSDSFTYTATNAEGTSAPATVTITVNPQPPVAGAASATVAFSSSNNPITLNLSGGTATSVAVATPATNGTATASGTSITYTPTPGYSGSDSFTYTATNAGGTSSAATVTITVNPAAPIAGAVSATVAYNSAANPITLSLSGGTATSVAVATPATNGVATASGTTITYTPTAGYSGSDSFTYTATNAGGTSAPATVTITINPQPPVAGAASATVAFSSSNNPITLNLSGGTATSVAVATPATNGTATASGTSITYTPTPGYSGSDSFTYTATNAGGTSAPATVTITVNPTAPIAGAVSATVAYNSAANPITLSLSGGTATSVAVATPATNGTATASGTSITYTPTPGYFGADSFTYTATNAGGTSAPATVTITVNPQIPIAGAVSATVAFSSSNNPITLNLSGGTATSVAVATPATSGTATASGTSITYTPTPGYSGSDSFTYTATNAGGTSAPATVTITVNPTAPIAGAVSATVAYNSAANPITLSLSGGTATSVAVATPATNGVATASGTTITYTPTAGYSGSDSFTYTATNAGGTSAPATVTITVNPQIPIAGAVSATVAFNSSNNPITLNLSGGAPVSLATPSLPANGTVSISGTSITYTPTAGYFGADSFTYTATNAGGTSSAANVSITVTPAAPIAGAASATVAFESTANPITLNITGGAAVSVATPSLPTHGTVSIAGTAITYTPSAGYAGPDSFTYTATNAGGTSAPATVTITVNPPPPPVAGAVVETIAANASNAPVTLSLTGGTATSLATPTLPLHGTVSISGLTITYTPTAGYSGSDSFTYTATNLGGTSAPATVSVTVSPPTLTLSALATTGVVTAAYSDTVTAALGTAPYNYALTAGALPTGLGLTSGGVLSGTATAAGTFNFTVTATDAYGATGSRAYTITIAAPTITITSPAAGALPGVEAYGTVSQTITASGGAGAHSFSMTAGALPPGLTLTAGGLLSGTPTTPGTYNFSITATDSSAAPGPYASAPVAYSLTITAPTISLTPATLPAATTAVAYSATFAASGGIGPYGYALTAGALPPGASLTSGGALSGTPTAAGTYSFTVTATDSHGFTGATAYSLVVADPTIAIIAPAAGALPGVVAYAAYSQTFTASGGQGAHSFALAAGALPPGLSLTSGGVLSGAPTTPGTYNFSLTAADSSGAPGPFVSTPVAYSLTVTAPAIGLSPGSLPAATTAVAYSQTFTASGGIGPYTYAVTAGGLPPGLTLAAGVLSGTPTAAGAYGFTVTASDSHGFSVANAYSVTVSDPAVTIASPAAGALPGVVAYAAYSQTFTAAGGQGAHSFSLVAGALPPGLTLSAAGVLSGAPTAAGTYNFSLAASDSSGAPGPFVSAPVAYSLTVTAPTVSFTPATLPNAATAVAYSQTFTGAGGVGPYSYVVSAGSLPPGLTLSGAGVLSGTPTAAGSYSFTVTGADSHGFGADNAYTLVVSDPTVMITSPAAGALPGVVAYAAYNQTFTASGGQGTHSFALAAGALPPGLTLSAVGVLSGAPTTPGTYSFSVTAADSSGAPGPFVSTPVPYSLTVTAPTVSFTPATLPNGVTGDTYSQVFTAAGGTAPYVYTVASGAVPPGLALQAAGTLAGTPTTPGAFSFGITATDAHGFAATNAYALTIVDAAPVAAPDSASTPANQAVDVPVTVNDSGVITSIAVATAPSHGAAVVSGLNVAYTPAANYFGADSFTYTATGPGGTSAAATVSITVTPLAVPTAEAKTIAVLSGQTATIDAVAGSTGAPITTVAVAANPAHGTATVSGQSLVYTPAAGYSGTDSFTYTLANPFGVSAPATVTVTVNPAPIAAPPITIEIMAGQVATANLSAGATGGPFTGAAVVAMTPSGAGTAAIAADAAGYLFSFTPDNSFAGTAVVSYTLTNAFATSAPGTVTIIVTARPDPTQDPEVTGLIGAQDETARRFANAQIGNYNSRLESLRDGGGGGIGANIGFSGGSRELAEALDPVTRRRFAELGMIDPSPMGYDVLREGGEGGRGSGGNGFEGGEPSRLGLWAAGMVDFGERDRSRNQAGVEFTTDGLTAGADYRFSDQLVLGAGIGWGHDDSRVGDNGTRSQADGYSFAIYGSYQPVPAFFLDGVLGYGTLEFDSRRYIAATGDFAIGQRDGDQWFGSVTGGWDMRGGDWRLSPYGRLSSTVSRLDAFEETTGGLYALAYDRQTVRTLTGTLGLRGSYSYGVDLGAVTPRFRVEYSHDFQGAERTRLSYVDWVGGPVYGAYIAPLERNRVLGGLGVDILTLGGMRISLDYETLLGSDGRQQQVRMQIQTPF